MSSIAINGKFLGANLNGVHRTAAHYSDQLIQRASAAGRQIRLLAPHPFTPPPDFPHLTPRIERGLFGGGQGWEWFTLPSRARSDLLVNFCNLGPMAHPNSVVMIHDAQTFLYPQDYSGRQATAYRRLLPWIARRARRVLTVSEFSRQSLAAHGIGTLDKIDVIHNGTDHLLDTPAAPEILARHGLENGRFVLAIGSAKNYKNVRTIFKALQSPLPGGCRLVLAGGPGKERYTQAGWTPPDSTIFTGFVSDAELRALYASANAFLFPSLTEGFGLPPVEAMHCGTPVVSSRAGAMSEVCGSAALLLDPEDAQAWREAVLAVLQDKELADGLRHAGARRARQLTWDAAGTRLFELVNGLL